LGRPLERRRVSRERRESRRGSFPPSLPQLRLPSLLSFSSNLSVSSPNGRHPISTRSARTAGPSTGLLHRSAQLNGLLPLLPERSSSIHHRSSLVRDRNPQKDQPGPGARHRRTLEGRDSWRPLGLGESKGRKERKEDGSGLSFVSSLALRSFFFPLERDIPVKPTITFDSFFLHRRSTRSSLLRPSLRNLLPRSSPSPSNSSPSSSIFSSGTTSSPSVEYPFESWKLHLTLSMEEVASSWTLRVRISSSKRG